MMIPVKGKVRGQRKWMPTFSDLIESVSYKPGYELTLVHPGDDWDLIYQPPESRSSALYMKAYVPDSTRPPHEPYLLQFQMWVPHRIEDLIRPAQLEFLRNNLEVFELHERDEWLRVDGELVNDPHGKDR